MNSKRFCRSTCLMLLPVFMAGFASRCYSQQFAENDQLSGLHFDGLTEASVHEFEIPTGQPTGFAFLELTVPRNATVAINGQKTYQRREYRIFLLECHAPFVPHEFLISVDCQGKYLQFPIVANAGQCFDLDVRGHKFHNKPSKNKNRKHGTKHDHSGLRNEVAKVNKTLEAIDGKLGRIESMHRKKSDDSTTIKINKLKIEQAPNLVPPSKKYKEPDWLIEAKETLLRLRTESAMELLSAQRHHAITTSDLNDANDLLKDANASVGRLKAKVNQRKTQIDSLTKTLAGQNKILFDTRVAAAEAQKLHDGLAAGAAKTALLAEANKLHARATAVWVATRKTDDKLKAERVELAKEEAALKQAETDVAPSKKLVQDESKKVQAAADKVAEANRIIKVVDDLEKAILKVGTTKKQVNSLIEVAERRLKAF